MPKIEKMSAVAAETEYRKAPERKVGKWKALLEELKKSGEGVKVTDLSRGSAYSFARSAKEAGFLARTTDKGTTVIVAPKPKETKK